MCVTQVTLNAVQYPAQTAPASTSVTLLASVPGGQFRACTSLDVDFLRCLYASTRAQEFDQAGWPEGCLDLFLSQQFASQAAYYAQVFPEALHGILEENGQPFGRMILCSMPGELRLVDISLLPSHHNRGLGGAWMTAFLAKAQEMGVEATLHVQVFNPACRLYERLGFVPVEGGDEVYQKMRWVLNRDAS